MFEPHPEINSNIDSKVKLWRYMDFAKLVSLISNHSLYFCRTDKFKDVFEGKLVGYTVEEMYKSLKEMLSKEYIHEGEILKVDLDEASLRAKAEEFTEQTYKFSEFERENTFINCWHLNEYESAAMWELYSNEGIAIQTTFERLKGSVEECNETIYIGKVEYIDYATQTNYFGNGFTPFFTKRISFSHEREVRLLYPASFDTNYRSDSDVIGINFKVDLSELIESIYVSPDAPLWFVEVVKSVIYKFNINAEVIHSDLYKIK